MTTPFGSSPLVSVGADPAGDFGAEIDSGDFWPKIDPAKAATAMRIDGSISADRLRTAIIEGLCSAIDQLSEWAAQQRAAGYTKLADVPATLIDGESIHVTRFRRAIYCYAAADIAEHYRTTDATGTGTQRADLMESPIDALRRSAWWAISDILGRSRTVVELI